MSFDAQGPGPPEAPRQQIQFSPTPNRIRYRPITDHVRFLPEKERVVVKGAVEHVILEEATLLQERVNMAA